MNTDNYSPISILTVFSKVFESIIAEQLMKHFKKHINDMLGASRKRY